MSDDESSIVTFVPAPRSLAYADDVQERCYAIWSTSAAMNAEATVARYAAEVGADVPVPHPTTVNRWVRDQDWHSRRNEDFERNHGERLYEMQMRKLMQFEASDDELSKVLAGLFDDNPMAGALRIKVRELIGREVERLQAFAQIVPQVPAKVAKDFSALSLDEREAAMKAAVQAKKVKASHG